MVYLDDFIIMGSSLEECTEHTKFVYELLKRLGWLINYEKSSMVPATRIEYLGFVIDTTKMKLFIPSIKRKKFRSACQRLLKKVANGHGVRLRTLASLAGKLQSVAPAVPFCWLHLQAVVQTIRQRTEQKRSGEVRWDALVFIQKAGLEELRWWILFLKNWKEAQLFRNQRVSTCFQTRQTRAKYMEGS